MKTAKNIVKDMISDDAVTEYIPPKPTDYLPRGKECGYCKGRITFADRIYHKGQYYHPGCLGRGKKD